MKKAESIIRAWKDEEFRDSLNPGELAALPENPAGALTELSIEELTRAQGALAITTSSWVCGVLVTVTICDELQDFFNDIEPGEPPGKTLYCFAEGTPVRTPGGHRPIEGLLAGDLVLAFDEEAGAVREARVEGLDVHHGRFGLLDLEAGASRVGVTPGHLFHDRDGWSQVERLGADGQCLNIREKAQPVCFTGAKAGSQVYNVRVEGLGTYFVGEADLLVRDH